MGIEHKITLIFGYTDAKGVVHKDVTFGKRLKCGDLILLDSDPQGQNPTQYTDLIRRRVITSFGKLRMPVGLDVLLGLNSIDRQDLNAGVDQFFELSRDGRAANYKPGNVVQLRFGFDYDGTMYNVVEMNRIPTGRDEAEADTLGLTGTGRECFMIGRRITRISSENEAASVDGPIDLTNFSGLDAEDLYLLRTGGQLAEAMFRVQGKAVSGERHGEGGADTSSGNGDVGKRDPGSTDGTNSDVRENSEGAGKRA
ncbi:MAG TPA: hypothetical protein VGO43_12600 [Pyrinomonadaceae bacterium]|nr:hypothetical protein [Pyrinomonadaceae bacterium]